MKHVVSVGLVLVIGVGLLMFVGCQTKEVTSAKVYIQQDDWDKAIEQLEKAVELYPNDAEAHMLLGKGYGKKAEYSKMVEQFDASLAVGPLFQKEIEQEKDYYWRKVFQDGVTAYNGGDLDVAIKKFLISLVIDKTRIESYKNLALCYRQQEDIDNATATYEKLLKVSPKEIDIATTLFELYSTQEKYDEAMVTMQNAKKEAPENAKVLAYLALAYNAKGDTAKARQELQDGLDKNPGDIDLMFYMGRLLYQQGKYKQAIEYYSKVAEADPEDFESNVKVGIALLQLGQNEHKALREKEEKEGKEYPEEAANIKQFYQKALPYLEKAAELQPENDGVWYNLGITYGQLDQADKAKECFDRSDQLKAAKDGE